MIDLNELLKTMFGNPLTAENFMLCWGSYAIVIGLIPLILYGFTLKITTGVLGSTILSMGTGFFFCGLIIERKGPLLQ